jgi:glucoamylase
LGENGGGLRNDLKVLEMTDAKASSNRLGAPGAPGIGPTWSSGCKELVGCALGPSRLWFTIGDGIVNEVYYPRVDIPQIRDLGFIVADGQGFWVEVKRLWTHTLETAAAGVPAVRIVHRHDRFDLALRIVPCSQRDALLVEVELEGDEGLRPYALLAPHLGGTGHGNEAEAGRYRGRKILSATQGPFALALAAVDATQRDAWGRTSAGYVGVSDGWQDFAANGAMQWEYDAAGPGNVALLGELPPSSVLALAFGTSDSSAATLAVSALLEPFDVSWSRQVDAWTAWHRRRRTSAATSSRLPRVVVEQLATSAMVLRVHQDKIYPGSMVASLSVPWGDTRDDRGGYHLVWPRDLVACALGLLDLGCMDEPRDILRYLIATQHADGHWNQNQWLGGRSFWKGIQVDEAAFPVLLAAALAERGKLGGIEVADMTARALSFVARTGPASPQDRWEEDAGVNAFTLAVCIAALVAGAEFLAEPARSFATSLADFWNAKVEDWLSARDTAFGLAHAVSQYYVRAAPSEILLGPAALARDVPIRNNADVPSLPAHQQVSIDFLQLVRLGLRRADDPTIVGSLRLVDATLRLDTPAGPGWHRFTADGYGEHDDGAAYDGTGRGRVWPLLTGERGHYALCAGEDPLPYLRTMAAMSSAGGMIAEQVWDAADVPEHRLQRGKPTGGATPLAWAHAEFVRLAASMHRGFPSDRLAAVWHHYQGLRPALVTAYWCEHAPIATVPLNARLAICLTERGVVRGGGDRSTADEVATRDLGLGLHVAEFDVKRLRDGDIFRFDCRYEPDGAWTGVMREIAVKAS